MSTRKPVVLVTGASKGIGLAVTKVLLQDFNAKVVALARTQSTELTTLSSDSLLFIPCDIANEAQLNESIAKAKGTFGHIDGLVLNAATMDPMCRIGDDIPLSEWKQHFDVSFFSHVTALKASLPSLRESDLGGKVVFVGSGAYDKGVAGWAPYCASKAATYSLCRTLTEEETGITAVVVRPGAVATPMQEKVRLQGGRAMAPFNHQRSVRLHSEGKLVRPEQCGHVIAALALRAPRDWSGKFLSWDSDECKPFRHEADQ